MHKKFTYKNGLRVITVPMKSTKSVTVFVMCGVGSRHETRDINGASHFIEHLMFKGTKKRPTTLDISKALDSVGAEFNAATSKDWTGYYVKIDSKKVELALDVLSDMLSNSKFDKKEIDRERNVIVEEINMYHDNPMMYVEDVLEQIMYKGSTLGWEIAGPRKTIKEIPRSKLIAYRDKYYIPENTVVCIAGNIDSKIEALVKKYFNTTKEVPNETEGFKPFEFTQDKPQVKLVYKKTEQVQLALGFPGYSSFDDRVYAKYLLSVILGGNMSSKLFIAVRERKGLAYFVRSYVNVYQDTGNFIVQSGLDKSRLEMAIKIILAELKKIKSKGVTADDLQKAKEYLRGKTALGLEETSNIADLYVKQELLQGKIMSPDQKLKKFDAVTAKEIQAVAKEMFDKDLVSLAIIGPFKDEKKFLELLKI